ncbi:MAG: hypothetical protein AABZ55_12860 [Bdellovibrionota bacterium]
MNCSLRKKLIVLSAWTLTAFAAGFFIRSNTSSYNYSNQSIKIFDHIHLGSAAAEAVPRRIGKYDRLVNPSENKPNAIEDAVLSSAPQGCLEWFAAIPHYELSNISIKRSVEFDKKYMRPFLNDQSQIEEESDAGLKEALDELQGPRKWIAKMPIQLGEKSASIFFKFKFNENQEAKETKDLFYWFSAGFLIPDQDTNADGCGNGSALKYSPKKADEFVITCGVWGKNVAQYYSNFVVTVPWSPSGGKVYMFNSKLKKWMDPVSFSWISNNLPEYEILDKEGEGTF